MAEISLPDNLIQQLRMLAERENRSVAEVLQSLLAGRRPDVEPPGDPEDAIRAVRRKIYEQARRYWRQEGEEARLALTDEELDECFWLIDPDGVPRLKSDQDKVDIPPNPLLKMAQAAAEANLIFTHNDVSERSREILNAEFGDYLYRRMNRDEIE